MPTDHARRPDIATELAEIRRKLSRVATGTAKNITVINNVTQGGGNVTNLVVPTDGTDQGPVIQAELDKVETEGRSREITVVGGHSGAPISINSRITIDTSRTTLRFGSPIILGSGGSFRIQGELDETPLVGLPRLRTDAPAGTRRLEFLVAGDAALFPVGAYATIRGRRDSNGKALEKQTSRVAVQDLPNNAVEVEDDLEFDALVEYVGATWPGSRWATIVRVTASPLTQNAARGDVTLHVEDASFFLLGDLVAVGDDAVTNSGNIIHQDMATVVQVDPLADTISLDRGLGHAYTTGDRAVVLRVRPVDGSHLIAPDITWSQPGTTHCVWVRYCRDCTVTDSRISGRTGFSWLGQAVRFDDSYDCHASGLLIEYPDETEGGEGYGVTFYGAALCTVSDSTFILCRHSVLWFQGAVACWALNVRSIGCLLADFDAHGANSVDGGVDGFTAIGADYIADDGSTLRAVCKTGNPSHRSGDQHFTFRNGTVSGYHGAMLDVVPTSRGTLCENVRMLGGLVGIRMRDNSNDQTLTTHDTTIRGCTFEDVAELADINGDVNAIIRGLTVEGCTFVRAAGSFTVAAASGVRFRRNTYMDPQQTSGYGLELEDVADALVQGNDFTGCARGVRLENAPAAKILDNTMWNLADGFWLADAGGSDGWAAGANWVDHVATVTDVGAGPSPGRYWLNHGDLYPGPTPAEQGMLEWSASPEAISAASATPFTAGRLYFVKIPARHGGTVSRVVVQVGEAGAALADSYIGVLDAAGVLLAATQDESAELQSTGLKHLDLDSPVTLTRGGTYYAAILIGTATTRPAFSRVSASVTVPNAGLTPVGEGLKYATFGSGLSAIPDPVPIGSTSDANAIAVWVGLEP